MKKIITLLLLTLTQPLFAGIFAYQQHSQWIVMNTAGTTLLQEYFLSQPKVTASFFAYEQYGYVKVINEQGQEVFNEFGTDKVAITDSFAAFQKYGSLHIFGPDGQKMAQYDYPYGFMVDHRFYIIKSPLTYDVYNSSNQKILQLPVTSKVSIKGDYIVETTFSNQTTLYDRSGQELISEMFLKSLLLP